MNWTTPGDIREQLNRLWRQGELLRTLLRPEPLFPLRLKLKGPTSADITRHFDQIRQWAAQLAAQTKIRIEWQEIRHRVQGVQRLPSQLWVDTLDQALALTGHRQEMQQFQQLIHQTRERQPVLLGWLEKRPLQALQMADDWPLLLDVVQWLCEHPRPGLYLRQVSIPGVHSKFIEARRGVLTELCDLALPATAIDDEQRGVTHFNARFGFCDKPLRIRFRTLDKRMGLLPAAPLADITLDADTFAHLSLAPQQVFITENEINFLTFPPVEQAIILFGAGYGWEMLQRAHWLNQCRLYYWGDIDTHGFAILAGLRRYFPHVRSFLMDRATLMACQDYWDQEPTQTLTDLPELTPQEQALFNELRDNRIRPNLRLEQERVDYKRVEALVRQD
ncbi:MAG: DUF3322 domain-containing protein [Enterobacteriaceae bacterium]